MDLTIYDVIIGSVGSDKAQKLNKNLKQLVLRVHPKANKSLVKESIEKLFEVKVDRVNISVRKGKSKRVRGRTIMGSLEKTAFVKLAGEKWIDSLSQSKTPMQVS